MRAGPTYGVALWLVLLSAAPAAAQDTHEGHAAPADATAKWQWTADGVAFFGFNYQHRKFRDFSAWESQNWVMAAGSRALRGGALHLETMVTLEPFTMRDIGSPQVFQTGETFGGGPLIDYQHPHDVMMGLGMGYRRAARAVRWEISGSLVGGPAFGPTPFMHRASARDNPQAPLSHHHLDATHITPGVVTAGIGARAWTVSASWFRGREPDERRTDLDLGALDSYSLRLGWVRGAWSAQVSGARLNEPEAITPYDADRLSASVSYARGVRQRPIALTAAFAQKREIHGNLEAYLLEARLGLTHADAFYARLESVAKDILDAGFHPRGVFHRHRQSQVAALTLGYVRDVLSTTKGRIGFGVDATGYGVPRNLDEPYGSPASFHFFLRYRRGDSPATATPHH